MKTRGAFSLLLLVLFGTTTFWVLRLSMRDSLVVGEESVAYPAVGS